MGHEKLVLEAYLFIESSSHDHARADPSPNFIPENWTKFASTFPTKRSGKS
jgi:hypothetical protein